MRHAGLISRRARRAVAVVVSHVQFFGGRYYGRRYFGKRYFG